MIPSLVYIPYNDYYVLSSSLYPTPIYPTPNALPLGYPTHPDALTLDTLPTKMP